MIYLNDAEKFQTKGKLNFQLSNPNDWIRVQVSEADIQDAKLRHVKSRWNSRNRRSLGQLTRNKVFSPLRAWEGFLGEIAVQKWIKSQFGYYFPSVEYDRPVNRKDNFDLKIGENKIDVKASLLLNKEQYEKKKVDVYLFCEFNYREQVVVIFGWLWRENFVPQTHQLLTRNMHSPCYAISPLELEKPIHFHTVKYKRGI